MTNILQRYEALADEKRWDEALPVIREIIDAKDYFAIGIGGLALFAAVRLTKPVRNRMTWAMVLAGLGLIPLCIAVSGCAGPEGEGGADTANPIAITPQPSGERAADTRLMEIHQKWVGTPWTFSGTSQVAGEGSIACGYFVTTTLQEAGLDLDRVRLAQAASEEMILEITDPNTVRRFSDEPIAAVLDAIKRQGEGYYIVGLDSHTGFLKVEADGEIVFIHSGPGRGVVFEDPGEADEFSSSRYRVTGKITWGSGR